MFDCTEERDFCKEQGVTGFPTLVLYRGYGYNSNIKTCIQEGHVLSPYVQMVYHGVLLVSSFL